MVDRTSSPEISEGEVYTTRAGGSRGARRAPPAFLPSYAMGPALDRSQGLLRASPGNENPGKRKKWSDGRPFFRLIRVRPKGDPDAHAHSDPTRAVDCPERRPRDLPTGRLPAGRRAGPLVRRGSRRPSP